MVNIINRRFIDMSTVDNSSIDILSISADQPSELKERTLEHLSPFNSQSVGRRIEALRNHHGMNRATFAKSVGIDATSYGLIEKGKKPLKADMAFRISERWGVSMDFIYRGRLTEIPAKLADSLMTNLTDRKE